MSTLAHKPRALAPAASAAPLTAPSSASTQQRARKLLRTEIDFIANREFAAEPLPEGAWDHPGRAAALLPGQQQPTAGEVQLPSHLRRMCEGALLTAAEEQALFRAMNLLKYQANALRARIDPDQVEESTLDSIESLLAQARQIRDQLIQANMRLAISIVKKFVTPQQSFDDLLSEGILILMKAVEKFDFDRGFRFSTYAYRSILRHVYRTVNLAKKEEARFTRDAETWAFEDIRASDSPSSGEPLGGPLQGLMTSLLKQLDRRERFIIRNRFGLGFHSKVRTLQYLADQLGVSKERVRQLEKRALGKLEQLAAECLPSEPLASVMP